MTEEMKVVSEEAVKETVSVLETVVEVKEEAVSPFKEDTDEDVRDAVEHGWKPDGEYSARTFNKIGKTIASKYAVENENKVLKTELVELKKGVETLVEHNKRLAELKRQEDLQVLEQQRIEAISVGDVDKALRLEEHKKTYEVPVPVNNTEVVKTEQEFRERNKDWFNTDTSENYQMSKEVYQIVDNIKKTAPNTPPAEMARVVEYEIQAKYPHRFSSSKTVPAVSGSMKKSTSSHDEDDYKFHNLDATSSELLKMVEDGLVKGLSVKEYKKQLKTLGYS